MWGDYFGPNDWYDINDPRDGDDADDYLASDTEEGA